MDLEVEESYVESDYEIHINDFAGIYKFLLSPVFLTTKAITLLLRFFLVFVKTFSTIFSTQFGHPDAPTETDDEPLTDNGNKNVAKLSDMDVIKLKIGDLYFEESSEILKRYDGLLRRIINSDIPSKIDDDGYVIIKRDGTHFEKIIKFMRTGHIDFPPDPFVVRCIRVEADFYGLVDLIKECNKFLDGPEGRIEACLRAVCTLDERNAAIATKKPIVFLRIGAFHQSFVFHDNTCKTITTVMTEFIKSRTKFPQFFFIFDYTLGYDLTMDFYFGGELVQKLDLFSILNNQCAINIDYQVSSAITKLMAKMLDTAGYGRAVAEDGRLALTL